MKRRMILSVSAVCLIWSVASLAADPAYQVIDVGTLGGNFSSASNINDSGQIVGRASTSSGAYHAFLFDYWHDDDPNDLGTLGGDSSLNSLAYGISGGGTIGGYSYPSAGSPNHWPVIFKRGEPPQPLGLPHPNSDAGVHSVSATDLVGWGSNPQGYNRALRWVGGTALDLGTLGGPSASAASVNDSGQIVGFADNASGFGRATIFFGSTDLNRDLKTLSGTSSDAAANNNLGQIVGRARTASGDMHATLFDPTGGGANVDLGTLGGSESGASSINDHGQIVGWAYDASGVEHATLFDPTGGGNNQNLNDLIDPGSGWHLRGASHINNNGWIVGEGSAPPNGETHGFLLIPGPPRERTLKVTATVGGHVVRPGEGFFKYPHKTLVSLRAQAQAGYEFSGWTGTAVDAGAVADANAARTTLRMRADYSLCANFTGPEALRLLSPNGGEIIGAGSVFVVRWESPGPVTCVNLELSIEGGARWTPMGPCTGGGQYDWSVPYVESDQCLVRITAANAALTDTSDAPFSIRIGMNGRRWYVDAAAAPGGDGTSWETAFVCLQDGVASAREEDSVWVAEGLYWPDLGAGQAAGDRTATFQLKNGVVICGGFPTGGGTWAERDPFRHQSILSGNLGDPNKVNDNSYHVVTASDTDKTAILDGLTICDGFADGAEPREQGAGLYNLHGDPQVRNCIFVNNTAPAGNGGGACNIKSEATFINCVFNSNTAGNRGGGMYNRDGAVTITNCSFVANQGLWQAGGLYNVGGSTVVANSIFWGNGRSNGSVYDEMAQLDGVPQPAANYCCIQSWANGLGGQGNSGTDPLFADTDGLDDKLGTPDDDLRLQAGSPCIDRGNDALVPFDMLTDQQGGPRIAEKAVDIGAYEFSVPPAPGV